MSTVALWLCAFAAPLEAQVLDGSVVGVAKNAEGGRNPGATVTIVHKDTNLTRETATDTEGSYNFVNVRPGPYDVKLALTGFRDGGRSNVPVTIGQISRVDITLEVGP